MRPQASKQYHTIALHNVDQAYGGPEDGGWYYSCGMPCDDLAEFTRTIKNRNAAERYAEKLNKLADDLNHGKREVSSVIYDGDRVTAIIDRGPIAKAWPPTRPYYD